MDATAYLKLYRPNAERICPQNDSGHFGHHRHHGHGGHRHQPVPGQGRHGHRAQSTSSRTKTACASPRWTRCATAACCGTTRPLTDFWRVGKGIAQKLETHGMFTMGDVARCSLGGPQDFYNEEMLYRLFGVNAELLIDHAWGWEPCTIADIKAYKPAANSCGSGQVLHCATPADQARLIVREMADQLALDLVDKHLMTNQLVLTVGYDRENLTDPTRNAAYHGPVATDRYGRQIPKHAHGTTNLRQYTSSSRSILDAVTELFDRIVDKHLLVRRVNLVACRVLDEDAAREKDSCEQLDFFSITESAQQQAAAEEKELERERRRQQAMLAIKKKFGKNAIIKGMDLQEGATAMERNAQIGGHKA